ncbi:MAG TPA: transglutaminase family protein [Noviherbaspirillum sp.]|jgi:transglutaminase-like putative cysteine protease|uniref:transglutaminase-like domain-containing protein n=1 Tax=Noviherbaspirillum sp. TaxID=1926288 RepID=UPI002F946F70
MQLKSSAERLRRTRHNPSVLRPGNEEPAPANALTIAAGCELVYAVEVPTSILLLIQPRPHRLQKILTQSVAVDTGLPVRRYRDTFGNDVLRTTLRPGQNRIRHEAVVLVPDAADGVGSSDSGERMDHLPFEVLRYTMPSRYCESDNLTDLATALFGGMPRGAAQAQAISSWVHRNIEYRCGAGFPHLSAQEVLRRGYGVCRDLAHVMIALCRALDLPARYIAGHIPKLDDNRAEDGSDMGTDFHAYCEVYLGGRWLTFDPRHDRPLKGRIKIAQGMDAVDTAIATMYGTVRTLEYRVWSRQVDAAVAQADGVPLADACANAPGRPADAHLATS